MTTPIEPNPPRWSPSTDPTSIAVPGLDTNAPINDQIDQIEQLITIKLQNIDANFSRIQNLMATRLLPAVKRYAVGTEPVREAAKFWTSFYEQAAQVHIPTLGDEEEEQIQPSVTASEIASVSQTEPADITPSHEPSQVTSGAYDVTASESSFMPTNAVSSTPARPGHAPDQTVDEQPSWSASLELPMTRLKNELRSFAREEEEGTSVQQDTSSLTDSIISESYEEENTIQQLPSMVQGMTEMLDRDEPIEYSRIPQSALPTPRANVTSARVSPLKVKPKTPVAIPKIQSFLASKLENFEPVFPSPHRPRYERTPKKPTATVTTTSMSTSLAPSMSTPTSESSSALDVPSLTQHASDLDPNPKQKFTAFNDSFDDSIDLMQGMSPPRTLAFARAPRSSMGLGLLPQFGSVSSAVMNKMKTPAFGYGTGITKDDTTSTIPTPPSLSRYTRQPHSSWTDSNDTDASLATMMRRVGLDMPGDPDPSASRSGASSQADAGSEILVPPMRDDELHTPDPQRLDLFDDDQTTIQLGPHPPADADSDSDSDSLNDEPVHPSQPSTAFIMASSREPGPDDSFGSSNSNHSMDSIGGDAFGGEEDAAVHPFARALEVRDGDGDCFDDSFDSEAGYEGEDHSVVEETVFGIPPAQRRQPGREPGQLKLLGEDLLQDTFGTGRVEESPTPYRS